MKDSDFDSQPGHYWMLSLSLYSRKPSFGCCASFYEHLLGKLPQVQQQKDRVLFWRGNLIGNGIALEETAVCEWEDDSLGGRKTGLSASDGMAELKARILVGHHKNSQVGHPPTTTTKAVSNDSQQDTKGDRRIYKEWETGLLSWGGKKEDSELVKAKLDVAQKINMNSRHVRAV